jgi:hypothetical protein
MAAVGEIPADSTSLDALAGVAPEPVLSRPDSKMMFILFILYLMINSTTFLMSFLAPVFGQKVLDGTNPSTAGVVLQGTFLVLAYILASYLSKRKVI